MRYFQGGGSAANGERQKQVDQDDWAAALPDDGLFDAPAEAWTLHTPALAPGPHTITVEAKDSAGNTTTTTVRVK